MPKQRTKSSEFMIMQTAQNLHYARTNLIKADGNIRLFTRIALFALLGAIYIFKYDGNDYSMYENYYDQGISFEIGYEAVAALCKMAHLEFKYFYGIYSAINLILFGILSRWRTEKMLLGLIPLMLFPGLPLNTIRQFTASLICAIAYERLYGTKNKNYIFLILLACQFHISSALFLVPLALKKVRLFALAIVISGVALFYFHSYAGYLMTKISFYTDGSAREGWYEQSAAKSIIFLLLGLALLGQNYLWRAGEYKKYRPIFLLAAISMLASAEMSIFMRFSYLFLPAISAWMYTCSRRIKLGVFFPMSIAGVINTYLVLAVWSGEAYHHKNYLFDIITS